MDEEDVEWDIDNENEGDADDEENEGDIDEEQKEEEEEEGDGSYKLFEHFVKKKVKPEKRDDGFLFSASESNDANQTQAHDLSDTEEKSKSANKRRQRLVFSSAQNVDLGDVTENSDDEFAESKRGKQTLHKLKLFPRKQKYNYTKNNPDKIDRVSKVATTVVHGAVNPFLSSVDLANLASVSRSAAKRQATIPNANCAKETIGGAACLGNVFASVRASDICVRNFCSVVPNSVFFLRNMLQILAHGIDITYSRESKKQYLATRNDIIQGYGLKDYKFRGVKGEKVEVIHLPFRGLQCIDYEASQGQGFEYTKSKVEVFKVGKFVEMKDAKHAYDLVSSNVEDIAKFVPAHSQFKKWKACAFRFIFHNMTPNCKPRHDFVCEPFVKGLHRDEQGLRNVDLLQAACSQNGINLNLARCEIFTESHETQPFVCFTFAAKT